MKKLLLTTLLLLCASPAFADGWVTVDSAGNIFACGQVPDSGGYAYLKPDSMRVKVIFTDGTAVVDAWYNSADAQCFADDSTLCFVDQLQDVNGDKGPGSYIVEVDWLYDAYSLHFRAWTGVTATDTVSTQDMYAHAAKSLAPTTVGRTLDVTATGEGGIDLDNTTGTLDSNEISMIRVDVWAWKTETPTQLSSGNVRVDVFAMQSNVITSTVIAADAIGASELAASAIGNSEWAVTSNVNADVLAISTDAGAADNLETMLDGTGGQTLSLGQLRIDGSTDQHAVWITAHGAADGVHLAADTSGSGLGDGFEAIGGGLGGYGMYARGVGGTNAGFLASSTSGAGQQGGVDSVYKLDLSYVWRLIDTLTTLDSSDVGAWLVNNLSGAAGGLDTLSDAQKYVLATIFADSVWRSLVTARNGTLGSWGDSASDWGRTGASTGGSGAYLDTFLVVDTSAAPDDTLENRLVTIHNLPRTEKYESNTGSTGLKALFHLDDGSWTASIQGPTYYQDGGIDTLTQPAKDTNFVIQVYQFAPVAPGSADSITLLFNMPNLDYFVKVTPLIKEEGQTDTSGNIVLPKPIYGTPDTTTKIAQVIVLRSSSCSPALEYEIVVRSRNPREPALLNIPHYTTGDATSETVTW